MSRDDSTPAQQANTQTVYAIPASRITWARICLSVLLAASTLTLAAVLTTDEQRNRPLWLILLLVALALSCLLLTYTLNKAIVPPESTPSTPPPDRPA